MPAINPVYFETSTALAALTQGSLTVDEFLKVAQIHSFPAADWGQFYALLGKENFSKFCSLQHMVTIAAAGRHIEKPPALRMKVSAKGAVSIYGLQKFPVTLYANQWERILDDHQDIRDFIAANESQLDRKGGE